ncbi:3-mercaptopyruvate sulfurtransferase [Pontibacter cellulosilyticus]|uniref:3-mercaptopyruvate sulfurtransferase n=1 Tax=Pontibacter cellulosilyticus TaxID=1720253 RepID=A0A923N5X7_9BACT|nr:3-mercaptopyruvate sulfurtransferase [Pontibacter cellulosilyticus]MBC5993208.1 3-mercaptopyruvate sulfurtransferase [Pontibacter cellulosilyticus]
MIKLPSSPLVSVEWLHQHLQQPEVVVLDASLKQTQNTTSVSVEQPLQIPGARYFDIDAAFSDKNSNLPHMLPSPESFTREAQKLGINKNSILIIYDNRGIYSSPRAWWMFRAMGHEQVYVLDGGLPAWIAAGYTCEPLATAHATAAGHFEARYNAALVSDKQQVLLALEDENYSVIDARPAARFHGKAPEPRPGLRLGHMPNAENIPFEAVLEKGKMRSETELKELFQTLPLTNKKLIFSCGSGVTACITALGATLAGYQDIAVYDGSWSEWGATDDLPVVAEQGFPTSL